jgi:hypothetical protein
MRAAGHAEPLLVPQHRREDPQGAGAAARINGSQRIQVDTEQIDKQAAALFAEFLGEVLSDDADDE